MAGDAEPGPGVGETESILQEAERLVAGARNAAYGPPERDYAKTGMIWGALLHRWAQAAAASPTPIPVPARLACLCMIGVKLSRECNQHHRDNLVDAAGYAACAQRCAETERHGQQ